jgi:1-deoxy-D-xylulose-5-phosphate reductoisomerase
MKKISILGATGSIGQNTLNLISNEKDNFKVVGLTGAANIDLLARSAIDFGADIVATSDESRFFELKNMLSARRYY